MEQPTVITNIKPYSTEWWQARIGCFTAADIHKLISDPKTKEAKKAGELSAGALTYVLEKVHEKLTGISKAGFDNYATQWGVEHEPMAAIWYGKLTGLNVKEAVLCFHETIEGFSCTPDKFVNEDGLCEIKCPANGSNHLKHCFITKNEYFKKEHPDYYWQCVSQMVITKRKWVDFVSFDPRINNDLGMFIYRCELSEVDAELLENKVTRARLVYNEYLRLFSK